MHDQLANPFRKKDGADPSPRRSPPAKDGNPREITRLYVMSLVFLMAVAGMFYMWKTATTPPPKKASQGVGYAIRPDGTRQDATPEAPPLPPVKKDVALQDLPKDGVVDLKALAEPFRDGLDKPEKETPEFVAMLRVMLTSVTPELLAKRVNPELTADKAYHETQKRRGEVVRTYGRLVKIYTEPLDTTIPEKVEHVYLGIMMEYPSNRTVWFYLPEKPVDPKTGQPVQFKTYVKGGEEFYEDWVEVEGVVMRRYDYPSQFENERLQEPVWARSVVLFSKGVRIVAKPEMSSTKAGFVTVVVVVAVLLVAVVITAGIMTRRYGGSTPLRLAVAAARREKAKQAGGSPFPAPDPAKQALGAEVPRGESKDASPPP